MKLLKTLHPQRTYKQTNTMGLFLCPVCGREVVKIKYLGERAQSCSHACYAKARTGKVRGVYKKCYALSRTGKVRGRYRNK